MNEFLDIQKIKECICDLVDKSHKYDDYKTDYYMDQCLVLKSQINNLFNYPSNVLKYLFKNNNTKTKKDFTTESDSNWFVKLFGIEEQDYDTTKNLFSLIKFKSAERDGTFTSILIAPNGNKFNVGQFTAPSLGEIRELAKRKKIYRAAGYEDMRDHSLTRNLPPIVTIEDFKTGDILTKHYTYRNDGFNLIQAASQLNALEFVSEHKTPYQGITDYQYDKTQGPACALACAAGTFARNYYYQTPEKQINYLDEFEKAIENDIKKYFTIQNGYLLINGSNPLEKKTKLRELNTYLTNLNQAQYNELKNVIKTGLHQNVEIIFKDRFTFVDNKGYTIDQVYASALPVSYNRGIEDDSNWEKFATLILEAQYEATLLAAIHSAAKGLVITLLGGGAFGNKPEWIFNAIVTAIREVKKIKNQNFQIELNIKIAHYSSIDPIINKAKIDEELLK